MELPKLKRISDNAEVQIPQPRKKRKILLLSDDARQFSGIATVSRELILGTVEHFDWFQVGAAMKHPEHGKTFDLSSAVREETGVYDASVKVLAYSGYGDQNLIRTLMMLEKPDAIMHFTDPRQWGWLYEMEHEIRKQVPLIYLNIWDNGPDCRWNAEAYASCDLLMAISKQTYGINVRILSDTYGHELELFDPTRNTTLFNNNLWVK